jgi:hypothetical protein
LAALGGEGALNLHAVFPRPFENEKRLIDAFALQHRPMRVSDACLLFQVLSVDDLRQVPTLNIWNDVLYLLYSRLSTDDFPLVARKKKYHLWRDYDGEIAPIIHRCEFAAVLDLPAAGRATFVSKMRSAGDVRRAVERAAEGASLQVRC